MKAGKQLTLYESEVRMKAKQAEAHSIVRDFTHAIIYSGLTLHQADADIGNFCGNIVLQQGQCQVLIK